MSDALTPLRHAYGVKPSGPPLPPGASGHTEQELLRGARTVLEGQARPPLPSSVVDAVLARAAEPVPAEDAVDSPALAALAHALGMPAVAAGSETERTLLAQTLDALDVLPRRRPSPSVVSRVEAVAAEAGREASTGLASVRAVYDEGPAVEETAEVAVLRQSRQAVDRTLASRPQPRPSVAVVDAVLARAGEVASVPYEAAVTDPALVPLALAEGLPVADTGLRGGVEHVLLAQTVDALARLPRSRPPAHVFDAALTQAISRSPKDGEAVSRPEDRESVPPSRRRFPVGVWAGAGGLVLIALVAVLTLPAVPDTEVALEEAVADASGPPAALAVPAPLDLEPESAVDPVPSIAAPGATAPAAAPALVAAAAAPAPVAERPAPPPAASPRRAVASAPAAAVPAWEADDDLRTLSLRLQELDRETEGLAWDEPAEAFGMPAVGPTSAFTPGVRVVREGTPPARVRYRSDSSDVQR